MTIEGVQRADWMLDILTKNKVCYSRVGFVFLLCSLMIFTFQTNSNIPIHANPFQRDTWMDKRKAYEARQAVPLGNYVQKFERKEPTLCIWTLALRCMMSVSSAVCEKPPNLCLDLPARCHRRRIPTDMVAKSLGPNSSLDHG